MKIAADEIEARRKIVCGADHRASINSTRSAAPAVISGNFHSIMVYASGDDCWGVLWVVAWKNGEATKLLWKAWSLMS